MPERVTRLSFGHGAEQRGDVGVALHVGLLREVQVAAVGLALARERFLQVALGLRTLQLGHVRPLFFSLVVLIPGTPRAAARRSRLARVLALLAQPPEHHLGARDVVALRGAPRHVQPAEVDVEVANLAAAAADEVVVHILDVGVEAQGAGPEVQGEQLAQLGQLVEGLVHRLERDRLHLGPHRLVDGLGGGVRLVALQRTEDALALCGDLAAVDPEQVAQLLGCPHRSPQNTQSLFSDNCC